MTIGGRNVGLGFPVYIVAELSGNHLRSREKAVRLIETAKACGADAVKLQTYTADTMTMDSDAPAFRIHEGSVWGGRRLYDLYSEAATPWEWLPALKAAAVSLGIDLFSSPFDASAVDVLEQIDVPAYKIASFELVDIPLIKKAASTGKPIILSTGMASVEEIGDAIEAVRTTSGSDVALLKCTSAYPAPANEMHLRTIPDLMERFRTVVGLSDHTLTASIAVSAVTLGASVVEKHLTIDRGDGGPDSSFSVEPEEFRSMVRAIREVEKALGGVCYGGGVEENKNKQYRRSLFVVKNIAAGAALSEENVRSIRPGTGLAPKCYALILGRRVTRDLSAGTPLSWDLIES